MAVVEYRATRSLAAGHVEDEFYFLPLELTDSAVRSVQDLKNTNRSLSGKSEVQFFGQVQFWDIELAPVSLEEAEFIREFLDSTADGQTFMFDPYGEESSASEWQLTVLRDDDGYTERRFMTIGNGGTDDYVQFAFKIRSA